MLVKTVSTSAIPVNHIGGSQLEIITLAHVTSRRKQQHLWEYDGKEIVNKIWAQDPQHAPWENH
jgi:hypothetical protein